MAAGWAAAAGAAILAVLRATGWSPVPAVPALITLTPYAGLLTPVLLAAALGLRHRTLAVAAAVLLAVHAVWLVPRFTVEPAEGAAPSARLRVMTMNTLWGTVDPDELVAAATAERVDVLALVEVPAGALDGFEAAGLRGLLPHRVARATPGAGGTAIYARFPLRDAGDVGAGTTFANPRATMELPVGTVTVQAVHPPPPIPTAQAIEDWRHDLEALAGAVEQVSGPLVVLGDFNATFEHVPFRDVLAAGDLRDAHDARRRGLPRTWPATRGDGPPIPPFVHIDHVLVSDHFAVPAVHERELPGMDHRSVIAELALRPTG